MESVLRKARVHRNGTIFTYADDIDIIGRTKRDVTAAFSAFEWDSTKIPDLPVNEGKMKYMLSTSRLLRQLRNLFTLAPPLPLEMMVGL